mmetsp:Transcript_32438/g.75375  ORF Transcript_32438/g.75375 Transcript_32438/m.75375 type:complete len:359 (+) Transcript_32438:17-1093(+)|eukprot:CAMPEP_0171076448 /NCGR_PEP_ID=MMETSP0766_2-20121228/13409_1 /TAXON_ID=439317 /ORGANISM="Gambierdiscus australes, Strain CAWD 149" /LENGTH=358 /DNA_ID=CAMNT_0011533419 /DNA_START=17 /DNA_END=1093 /DNA_ORIENTATION=-
MDFDDLENEEEAAGCAVVIDPGPHDPPAGVPTRFELEDYMPPIPRNFRLPDFSELPEQIVKLLPEPDLHLKARPMVCIRCFVFYGAGDTWYAWAMLAATAPAYCEVAVHEWPFHGSRDEEDALTSLDALTEDALRAIKASMQQHAKGGRVEGAPFALIGHSIGCLVVVALAKRLREEYALEPAAVVLLDRAAPHIPLHSAYGQKYRDENPWAFMRDYNDTVYNAAAAAGGARGERMVKMWVDDVKIGSDTRAVGYHIFKCDVMLLRATKNIGIEALKDSQDPEARRKHATRDALMGSPPGWAMDCSPEQYEEWRDWVHGEFILKDIHDNHIGIKSNKDALDAIWDFLESRKAAFKAQL